MKRFRQFGKWMLRAGGWCALAFAIVWWGLPWLAPLPERLMDPLPESPTYLATDGRPLRQMLSSDGQRVAAVVPLDEIPDLFVHATLAAEDKRFFSHGGVDLRAVARAAWDNITHRRVVSGASTVTQQLVKISSDEPSRRSWWRKIVQALQARRLEMTWDKPRILTEYLNRVGYGNLLTGCASAAQGYFDKPLRDLTPGECAFLASLPQAPSRLNPFKNPKGVLARRNFVLERMSADGWLDDAARGIALTEKPTLKHFNGGFEAPHAIGLIAGDKPESSRIRTTIDRKLQSHIEAVISRKLVMLRDRHVTQAAAVVIENSTGRVLALAGSCDFFASDSGQINGAWTPHSAGSAVKPFTYLLALERGLTPASIIADLPVEFGTSTGVYRPENYDHRNYGPVTLRMALGSSLNIPAVKVLKQIGGEKILYDALVDLGVSTLDAEPEHYGLGLTVGNAPVRLLELANAYSCLARLGEFKPWTLLADAPAAESRRIFPESVSYLIADILSDNQARVPTFGPHSVIRLPFRCAVKTGTSRNYRDNWTMAYTPEFTVGVWAGNFDNTPMENVSGVSGAGPIMRDIFNYLHDTRGTSWFTEPADIVRLKIDPRTGRALAMNSPEIRMSREEAFLKTSLPGPAAPTDYEPGTGRAYLADEYAAWLEKGDHWLAGMVCLKDGEASHQPPVVIAPTDGTVIVLDPDLRDGGRRLMLQARGKKVRWSSPTLKVEHQDGTDIAWLEPGRHIVVATDEATGLQSTASIKVREPR